MFVSWPKPWGPLSTPDEGQRWPVNLSTPRSVSIRKKRCLLEIEENPHSDLIGSMGLVYLPAFTVVSYMDPMALVQFKYVFVIHSLYPANQL